MARRDRRRTVREEPQGHADGVSAGLAKVDKMIRDARFWGGAMAADHLRHWRDGSGKDVEVPIGRFTSQGWFLDHLARNHRPRFLAGAGRRSARGELAEKDVETDMTWEDSVNAPYPSDIYFALGGFTVRSKVRVKLIRRDEDGNGTIRFVSWLTSVFDEYDWDHGKATLVPGSGTVSDDELRALERAGYGRAFTIRSAWARITEERVVADGAFRADAK